MHTEKPGLSRRSLMASVTLALSAGEAGRPAQAAATPAVPPTTVTADYVAFARGLQFDGLPQNVVHAAKRYLLDGLGCALAGWTTDKGRIAADAATSLGGAPQARVLGASTRTSVANAAFANGELLNALDYDALPHLPPMVIPPLLAVAEQRRASGRDLIVGCVAAHELAARLSAASSQMMASLVQTGSTPDLFGINQESIIGVAAGLANLLRLDEQRTAYALGLAAYYCPPQSSHDWETGSPKSMVKYVPVGWICQGAVTAAMLAEKGFTANPSVLDGPAAFPHFYGWAAWNPETAVRDLNRTWRIETVDYKPYACCRFIHSQLDCLVALMERHPVDPEDIQEIRAYGVPFVANPDPRNVRTQIDAQFSTPYMLAVAANRLPLDARCQDHARLTDPVIQSMMRRISFGVHPDSDRTKRADPRTYVARIELVTRDGRTLSEDSLYASGTGAIQGSRLADEALEKKFLQNAASRLPAAQAQRAMDMIWTLDRVPDVTQLVDQLVES